MEGDYKEDSEPKIRFPNSINECCEEDELIDFTGTAKSEFIDQLPSILPKRQK